MDYLITEKPVRALIKFSLPMIVGNLFQQAYTIVDSAIVGHYNGESALAAVGASYALTSIFICIAIGGGIGASVIISQHFGAEALCADEDGGLHGDADFFLAISVLLAGVGLLFSEQIMVALNTPSDALGIATVYLNIYFTVCRSCLCTTCCPRCSTRWGNRGSRCIFLIFSSLLNVGLDWYLVAIRGYGVPGAAYATFAAQGLSAVLSLLVFLRELRRLRGAPRARSSGSELERDGTDRPAVHFAAVKSQSV